MSWSSATAGRSTTTAALPTSGTKPWRHRPTSPSKTSSHSSKKRCKAIGQSRRESNMGTRYGILLVSGSHTHQENYGAAFAADKRCRVIAVTDEANIDRHRRELNE